MSRLHVRLTIAIFAAFAVDLSRVPLAASQEAGPQPAEASTTSSPALDFVDLASVERLLGKDAAQIADSARRTWTFVLVQDHDKRPVITVGTVVSGIILMGLGYIAARMISRWLASKLLTRFGLNRSGVAPL